MDFQFSPEQRMLRDLARDFAQREILPAAGRYDREARFPHDLFQAARRLGLIAPNIPEAYGGAGLGLS
jgi:alkylation response protein AidB-like acyl-CoA dehydrogenase